MLTVRLDVPEPWNVQTASAIQDTDNLRCSPGHCGDPHSIRPEHTVVTYALKNLLVAGQCFEGATAAIAMSRYAVPPNGLQLTLTSVESAPVNKTGTRVWVVALRYDELMLILFLYVQVPRNLSTTRTRW